MRINNNIMAMNTYRQLGITNTSASKSMEKLSSGLRINRAGDDAAGLSISEKMRAQIRGLNMASKNAQDGISLIQTAEGALQETHAILQRMRELAVQSANDTNVEVDRAAIQAEIDELAAEITRIAETTEFNTQKLLDGKFAGKFHIGANKGQDITLSINKMDSLALGVGGNETVTKAVSGVQVTGLPEAVLNTVIEANAEFTVEKLENKANVGSVIDALYILRDADGKIVGASADGKNYIFAEKGAAVTNKIETTNFGAGQNVNLAGATLNKITTGTIKFTEAVDLDGSNPNTVRITFNAENTLADSNIKLGSGKYVVVDGSTRADVGTNNQVLVNKETNEVVAVGDDDTASTVFTTLDGATKLFTSASALTIGEEIDVSGLGGIDVSSQAAASAAITTIQKAIETVSAERSKLGAYQNRLEHTIKNLDTSAENLQASESRIRDVDMAKEMMEFTKNNILQQAATAMLAQANQAPQTVLQLLR